MVNQRVQLQEKELLGQIIMNLRQWTQYDS